MLFIINYQFYLADVTFWRLVYEKVITIIFWTVFNNVQPKFCCKERIGKLEKKIRPSKKLYKIYWADGTFVGEYWA